MKKSILHKRKTVLTQEQIDDINSKALIAEALLEGAEFKFYRDYLDTSKASIEDQILRNTIKDVTEQITIGTMVKKFFTPKKQQVDELAGMYRLLSQREQLLRNWIKVRDDMRKEMGQENVTVK